MADARAPLPSQATSTYLLVPILMLFALLIAAVLRGPTYTFGLYFAHRADLVSEKESRQILLERIVLNE